jgi:hypothetical protein
MPGRVGTRAADRLVLFVDEREVHETRRHRDLVGGEAVAGRATRAERDGALDAGARCGLRLGLDRRDAAARFARRHGRGEAD